MRIEGLACEPLRLMTNTQGLEGHGSEDPPVRGRADLFGRPLQFTTTAIADQIAAAADLVAVAPAFLSLAGLQHEKRVAVGLEGAGHVRRWTPVVLATRMFFASRFINWKHALRTYVPFAIFCAA